MRAQGFGVLGVKGSQGDEVRTRARVRCFVVTGYIRGCCVYGSVAEGYGWG